MTALLSWRVWAAISLAVVLAATNWKAYTSGKKTVQAEWNIDRLRITNEALAASEAARAKEQELQTKVRKVSNDYQAEKTRRVADAVASADRLRELETALDSAASADTSSTGRTDDPPVAVARQCARSLVLLDEYAQGLASQTRGLQDYALNVCMTK